jgi:hypothetical protein
MRASVLLLGIVVSFFVASVASLLLSSDPGVTLSTAIHVYISVFVGLITFVLVTALAD